MGTPISTVANAAPLPRATRLYAGRDCTLTDYVCTAGPGAPAFEETREGFTIAAVVAGSFRFRADSGDAILHPGAVLLGNHATCYACGHDHSRGDRCIALNIAPAVFAEVAASAAGSSRFHFRTPMLPATPVLQSRFGALVASLAQHDPAEIETRCVALVEDVLAMASATLAKAQQISAQDERRIARVLRHIEQHLPDPLDLDVLAGVAGMSKYHFLRTFRRITGQPPHQYVLGLRLSRVAERLAREATPIARLALDVGFGDLSTFNNRFKRLFGQSPKAWRRRNGH